MQAMAAQGRCTAPVATASRAAAKAARLPLLRQQQQLGSLRAQSSGCRSLHRSSYSPQQRQIGAIQPQAATGAAAAGNEPGPVQPQQPAKPKQRREMSLQQRWRAAKFKVQEAREWLSETPPVTAVANALAALTARLQPLFAAWEQLERKWEALLEVYNEFLVDETKRQWRWSNVYAKELAWWSQVPPFFAYFGITLLYEAFMPVSFVAAVAVPLWYAWVLWDDWWRSPIFLALLLTAPMKWVPWADMCLLWPGII